MDSYKIVKSKSANDLAAIVNGSINAGWQPLGGVSIGAGGTLYQAMGFTVQTEMTTEE